jgi:hypothetical protein
MGTLLRPGQDTSRISRMSTERRQSVAEPTGLSALPIGREESTFEGAPLISRPSSPGQEVWARRRGPSPPPGDRFRRVTGRLLHEQEAFP